MRAEDLFDAGARDAIENAVQAAERRTACVLEPATGKVLVQFLANVLEFAPSPALWLPPVQLAIFVAGYWLAGRRVLLGPLVPARRATGFVDRAAKLAFVEHGLVETRDRTGILIYVSLLEHRVEVLADRGIDRHVEDGTWDEVVRLILDGVRKRRAEEGLCKAIERCGTILAAQFPPRPDDDDELENRLRT